MDQVIAQADKDKYDFRPRVKDLISNSYFLIDTGASLSIYPKRLCPDAKLDEGKGLQAVNGTTMPTYGSKSVSIRLNKKTFTHNMVISHIPSAILGWDWLVAQKIDIEGIAGTV